MLPYAFFEGNIVESDKANIRIASHCIQYGTVVFGGMRGYLRDGKARLFRVKDHHERLMNAAKILGMKYKMSLEEFTSHLEKLIKANTPQSDFYLRPFIYSDDEALTPRFDNLSYDLAVYMIALGDYLDTSRGLRLMVSSWKKFSDASIPTKAKAGGAYLNSSLARTEAATRGYDEALVMDDNWNIVEGSAENLMIVYRGEVIIPELGASALEGITLRTAIQLLEDYKIPYRFARIDRSMIYTCDEVLLTGTGAQILFAESVDDRMVGDGKMGPVCTKLRQAYNDIIDMKYERSNEWVSEFEVK